MQALNLPGLALAIMQASIGGGNALMKFALAAVVIFELILAVRMRIVLPANRADRRWLSFAE